MTRACNDCAVGPGVASWSDQVRSDSPNDAAVPQVCGIVWGDKAKPPVFHRVMGVAVVMTLTPETILLYLTALFDSCDCVCRTHSSPV